MQGFLALTGAMTIAQVYKVQEAVGDGASAVIQEMTSGTVRVFDSIFDGLNNTVKVSMLMLGICFVSMLSHWLQTLLVSWWSSREGRRRREDRPPTADRVTDIAVSAAMPLMDSPEVRDDFWNGDAASALIMPDVADEDVTPSGPTHIWIPPDGFGASTGTIAGLTLEHITRLVWYRNKDGTSIRTG